MLLINVAALWSTPTYDVYSDPEYDPRSALVFDSFSC